MPDHDERPVQVTFDHSVGNDEVTPIVHDSGWLGPAIHVAPSYYLRSLYLNASRSTRQPIFITPVRWREYGHVINDSRQ